MWWCISWGFKLSCTLCSCLVYMLASGNWKIYSVPLTTGSLLWQHRNHSFLKSCIIHHYRIFDHKCYFPWETISHIHVSAQTLVNVMICHWLIALISPASGQGPSLLRLCLIRRGRSQGPWACTNVCKSWREKQFMEFINIHPHQANSLSRQPMKTECGGEGVRRGPINTEPWFTCSWTCQ